MFESEEIVFLGIGTGLLSILPVAVTTVVAVVVSVVVVVKEAVCYKNAKQRVKLIVVNYRYAYM